MRIKGCWILWTTMVVLVFLAGCGDAEKKATAQLDQAKVLLQQGDLDGAEAALRDLIDTYPRTEAAAQAAPKLEAVAERRRELRAREIGKVLERLAEVVNGYRSMYASYPRRAEEIDSSDYFFDTGYMAEIVPADTRVYLALDLPGPTYRLWSLKDQADLGFLLDAGDARVKELSREEILKTVGEDYSEDLVKGNLVFMTPKRS